MLRFNLPEAAYKCKGQEVVNGKVFTDGELVVTDDVGKMIGPALLHFYDVTVEKVEEIKDEKDADPDADASLAASNTKK